MTGHHNRSPDAIAFSLLARARSAIICPCGSRLHVAGQPEESVRPAARAFFAVHHCSRRRVVSGPVVEREDLPAAALGDRL